MDKREIRARVRLRNAIPDTGDGLAGHTDIDDCITAALSDISSENRWPWLLTTASLTFTAGAAPLPADCHAISQLVVNGNPAERVNVDEFLQQARSWMWTEVGSQIQLWPVPATVPTATLWYYHNEHVLATDTQTPLIPAQHHQLVVVRASYQLNVRRGDNARIAQDLTEYQAGLRNLMQTSWRTLGPKRLKSSFRWQQLARW